MPNSRHHLFDLMLLTVLAALVFSIFIAHLPLDTQEAYIIRGVQEMYHLDEWQISRLNGSPTLITPPLFYWISAGVAAIFGNISEIQPWQARLPSVLSGIALVLLIVQLGTQLFNRPTGWIAGLIATSTVGLFNYGHSARPDALNALLCTVAIGLFIYCFKIHLDPRKSNRWPAYAMWSMLALACLTTGSQWPAILVVTMVVFLSIQRISWHMAFDMVRPVDGTVIFFLITGGWIAWAGSAVGYGQAAAALYLNDWALSPWNTFGFYFYSSLQLVLPWLVIIPTTLILTWRDRANPATVGLALLFVLPASLLNFSDTLDCENMLPSIGPMVILMSRGALSIFNPANNLPARWVRLVLPGHALVITAFLAWILGGWSEVPGVTPAILVTLAGTLATVFGINLLPLRRPAADLIALTMIFITLLIGTANSRRIWNESRFQSQALALSIAEQIDEKAYFATWDIRAPALPYYLQRMVVKLPAAIQPDELLHHHGEDKWFLLLHDDQIATLPPELQPRIVKRFPDYHSGPISLLELTPKLETTPEAAVAK